MIKIMLEPLFIECYQKIANNELYSRSELIKNIPAVFDEKCSEKELWKLHEYYMEVYREYKQKIYLNGNKAERKTEKSLLDLKILIAERIIENCHLCHHRCGVNRKLGEKGFCKLTDTSRYAAEFLHMGEEPELVPSHTVFFTGCVLSCIYCQNWDISMHPETGKQIDAIDMARIIDKRRKEGAKNLNLVTPTPHLHNILKIVKEISINTPVIWNSNMYHSQEATKLLEGVVDLFLADFKYGNNDCAVKYSKIKEYIETVTSNLEYAKRDAEILMRHLVLPRHLECCTRNVIDWTAKNTPDVRFNLMFQYRPEYLAYRYPEIDRTLELQEKEKAIKMVKDVGLKDVLL
ncbi:4Fe-4S cluster-binding domain-containing protein [Methanolobus mangrovi]|uniref:4Fe-4S cluster-binding domain-containing protein n=1 Tax=Methanolobus mangrovi TaxID=3072977 RepID=A0AA51UHD1_9EURY|nr:radical SAM protein [Methanolobus mangrovi]WMW23294.1 4Fe-4S cluster-binding domain-containing protein [Methanolobus mangrovi]